MLTATQVQMQLQRAQSLFQGGRQGEAWTLVAPLRPLIANHGQGLRLYALVAQAADDIDAAAEALRRIIDIEQAPPEIIGALADLLGKAGRQDAALAQWDRLVALQPGLADAHLNRAVTATNAGKHDRAVEAATPLRRPRIRQVSVDVSNQTLEWTWGTFSTCPLNVPVQRSVATAF